jgi:hypothetical protein
MEKEARASMHFHQMEALRNVGVNNQAMDAEVVSDAGVASLWRNARDEIVLIKIVS